MVTESNLQARKKYNRPQAVLFATTATRKKIPMYPAQGANPASTEQIMVWVPNGVEGTDWIILSDHNRTDLGFTVERVENRKRMIDATMRSYHTADKYSLSLSWSELPSRSSVYQPTVNTGTDTLIIPPGCTSTVDGGAGGSELKYWYDTHPGPFYVLLAYDDYKSVEVPIENPPLYNPLQVQFLANKYYKHAKLMFFENFTNDVVKRQQYLGSPNDEPNTSTGQYVIEYDTWNISMELVEA